MRELKSQGNHHTEEEFLRLSADQIVGFVEAADSPIGGPAGPVSETCFVMLGASKADRIRVQGSALSRSQQTDTARARHPLAASLEAVFDPPPLQPARLPNDEPATRRACSTASGGARSPRSFSTSAAATCWAT